MRGIVRKTRPAELTDKRGKKTCHARDPFQTCPDPKFTPGQTSAPDFALNMND